MIYIKLAVLVQNFQLGDVQIKKCNMKIILFMLLCLSLKSFSQKINTNLRNDKIDNEIMKSDYDFITADSLYNKIITKYDTIDLEKFINSGYYENIYRKAHIIIKVDSLLNVTLDGIEGELMDNQVRELKIAFGSLKIIFRKDLIEAARGRYIIQPLILFATDKKGGTFSTITSKLFKKSYKLDSKRIKDLYQVLSQQFVKYYFMSTPVSKKGWLDAIFLPTSYVNYGDNKYFYGYWYKMLE
jgi:hypothetical protein